MEMDAEVESNENLHAPSYYAATANRKSIGPSLKGKCSAEVCVVGAGYSGLSTALSLAERGYEVVIVEAEVIGFGASGRNGGQIVNGLNASVDSVRSQFGETAADFVGKQVQIGGQIIRDRIKRYNIDCDLKQGNIFAAYTNRHMKELEHKQVLWRKYGMDDHELLDAKAMRSHVGSDVYCGGMIDHSGGHLHPLNLALGEAAAVETHGGKIFERSPAQRIEKQSGKHVVSTLEGSVQSNVLVICGNAHLSGVVPDLEKRVMPVSTQIIATEPLSESEASSVLPSDMCVEDVRYVLDYFRLTADRRMLFGGGVGYGGTDPANIRASREPHMHKIFPQLKGKAIDFAWGGNIALSYSRVPQMGRLEDGAYFAHGYSGHGVTGSHLFGSILADAIDGDQSKFDMFAGLPYFSFPGGRTLRIPYSIAGSWWYGLRDKLGV